MFQCGVPKAINFLIGEHCLSWDRVIGPMNVTASTFNAVIDWIFVLTPTIVVFQAMMPMRTKVSVSCVIALGALGSAASVARIPLLDGLKIVASLDYFSRIIPVALVSIVESGIGIIAISLATLRPLVFGRYTEKTRNGTNFARELQMGDAGLEKGSSDVEAGSAGVRSNSSAVSGSTGSSESKTPLASIKSEPTVRLVGTFDAGKA